jgi:hypothetical protein
MIQPVNVQQFRLVRIVEPMSVGTACIEIDFIPANQI